MTHTSKPASIEGTHLRTYRFAEEGRTDSLVNRWVSLMDHKDGLMVQCHESGDIRSVVLDWEMLFDHCSQIADDPLPNYECLNCGADYGKELMSDFDPLDSCEEHSTGEGEGIIVRKGDTEITVWIWAHVSKTHLILGYNWYWSMEKAEEYISSISVDTIHAMTLEPVTIPFKQDHYEIQTKLDLEAAIDRYWLDNREQFLLKIIAES